MSKDKAACTMALTVGLLCRQSIRLLVVAYVGREGHPRWRLPGPLRFRGRLCRYAHQWGRRGPSLRIRSCIPLAKKTVRTQQQGFCTDYISDLCQAKDKPRMQGDLEESISLMYFMQNLDSYTPKLHRLNASCALGVKALKVSNHAETSLWQTS